MPTGRKRLGLFGNAKYSRPVFRNVNPSVIEGAKKDIAALIRPASSSASESQLLHSQQLRKFRASNFEPNSEHPITGTTPHKKRKRAYENLQHIPGWNTSVMQNADISFDFAAPFSSNRLQFDPGTATKRQLTQNQRSVMQTDRQEAQFASIQMLDRSTASDFGYQIPSNFAGKNVTKNKKLECKAQRQVPEVFPAEAPMTKIANNMLVAFPRLTLRNNENTEYIDVVFNLAKNALLAQANRSMIKEKCAPLEHIPNARINKSAFKSMRDQTMFFDLDNRTESEGDWSVGDSKIDNESPTDFNWDAAGGHNLLESPLYPNYEAEEAPSRYYHQSENQLANANQTMLFDLDNRTESEGDWLVGDNKVDHESPTDFNWDAAVGDNVSKNPLYPNYEVDEAPSRYYHQSENQPGNTNINATFDFRYERNQPVNESEMFAWKMTTSQMGETPLFFSSQL